MLNISNSDIKQSDIITDGDTIYYNIRVTKLNRGLSKNSKLN